MKRKPELKMIRLDPQLKQYESDINMRMERLANAETAILGKYADISNFANGYMYFGFHRTDDGWGYREWAPVKTRLGMVRE